MLVPLAAFSAGAVRRPNVVLIVVADFGYDCVTANGGESDRTPVMDRLAATGVRIEQCHAQPFCTPPHVQLMTGLGIRETTRISATAIRRSRRSAICSGRPATRRVSRENGS